MSQSNLIEFPTEGNINTITSLLNESLSLQGITVKTTIQHNCLQILLESEQLPEQFLLIESLQQSLINSQITHINQVKVYAKITGNNVPIWCDEFQLPQNTKEKKNQNYSITDLKEKAKKGNNDSLHNLFNLAFKNKNIEIKVNSKNGYLQIILKAETVPDRQNCLIIIRRELNNLRIENLRVVQIYAKTINNDFPVWELMLDGVTLKIRGKTAQKQSDKSTNRLEQIIFWGFIVIMSIIIELQINYRGSNQIRGGINITDYRYETNTNQDCIGIPDYNNIRENTPVIVQNKQGQIIAYGKLKAGTKIKANTCFFAIEVNNVPNADIYKIAIGDVRSGFLIFSKEKLESMGWKIEINVGETIDN